jgi:hypothetical protein
MNTCSLRSEQGEQHYIDIKKANKLIPLLDEPAIRQWNHWKLVVNSFPYDICFKEHDLLIPFSGAAIKESLSEVETIELNQIINEYAMDKYDMIFENTMKRRSVPNLYHIHFASYYATRQEMHL